MEINYRTCPKCNSLDTIPIVYGYPSAELGEMADKGMIILGGCRISNFNPYYHCKNCENEWNDKDSIEYEYSKVKGINTHVGGYWGGYYNVDIDFENRRLKWSHKGSGHNEEYEKVIRQSSVDRLMEGLKQVHILSWQSEYLDLGVCDGTQWGIKIIQEGRTIEKYGSNQFPCEWEEFCKLIEKTSGRTFG